MLLANDCHGRETKENGRDRSRPRCFFFGFRSFAKTEVGREENVIEILLVDPVLRALTDFSFSSGRSESKSTNQSSQSNF